MRPCAGLSAYIGDRTAQGAAQRVMADAANAWRASEPVAAIAADLQAYGNGSDLVTGSRLADLVASFPAALNFAVTFLSEMAAAIKEQPLGHPCFWHSIEAGYTALHLLHSGRATLSLVVAEGDSGQTASNAGFGQLLCYRAPRSRAGRESDRRSNDAERFGPIRAAPRTSQLRAGPSAEPAGMERAVVRIRSRARWRACAFPAVPTPCRLRGRSGCPTAH